MSERRRLRAGRDTAGQSSVPLELRRFVLSQWADDDRAEFVTRAVRARRRWDEARREWASEHGFDVAAKHGEASGRDWWAFLAVARAGR